MICLGCRQEFFIKRNFTTLFLQPRKMICKNCQRQFPIRIQKDILCIGNKDVFLYSVCKKVFNLLVYLEDYSFLCEKIFAYRNTLLILMDIFQFNESTYQDLRYHCLANPDKNIVIVCFYVKK